MVLVYYHSRNTTRNDITWRSPIPNSIQTGQEIWNTNVKIPSRLQVIILWLTRFLRMSRLRHLILSQKCGWGFQSSRMWRCVITSYVQSGHSVLLPPAEMFTLVLQAIPAANAVRSYPVTTYDTSLKCPVALFELHYSHGRISLRHALWDIFRSICGVTGLKASFTAYWRSSMVW
jgi:hypothetical protein